MPCGTEPSSAYYHHYGRTPRKKKKKSIYEFGRKDIKFLKSQLEKKFKHAGNFDSDLKNAKSNSETLKRFHEVLKDHIKNPATKRIRGRVPAVDYYNLETGLNVMINAQTRGWELSPQQKFYLKKTKNLR